MAKRRVRHAPIDIRHRRERRVHQNHARRDGGVEMIVDLRRVEAGDGDAREQVIEQRRAGLGQFVQDQRTAGQFGEDGEQSGAGRRLEHLIGGRDGGGGARRDPERDGVENCWSAWLSSERRVWVGRRLAIFASIGSAATGDAALRKSALPCLRRNRTVAASQAS